MSNDTTAPTKPRTRSSRKTVDPTPVAADRVLILRSCASDMTSRNGSFRWPESGLVEAPDWLPVADCGNGLHGLLWGEGDAGLMQYGETVRYVVAEVEVADLIDLGGKVKFPRAWVRHVGDLKEAAAFIAANGGAGRKIIGGTSTSGDLGTSTSGDLGTSTSGYRGTSTSGDRGTSTSGDRGTSTSGYLGTSTSGYRGTSTSGYRGTSTSGDLGTSTSGYLGWCAAGKDGAISIQWRDEKLDRYRVKVGEIGIDGLEPGTVYRVDVVKGVARFVAVTDAEKADREAERERYR